MVPGRSDDTRLPTAEELRATLVVRIPLAECSAKVRTGGPIEEPDDLTLGHWAGELPLRIVASEAVPDGAAPAEPGYLKEWAARRKSLA